MLFIFSYIGLSEEDWSFSGIIAGITFIICIGPLSKMPDHFTLFYNSMLGMIFGGLITSLIMKFLLPFDFKKLLVSSIGSLASIYISSFDIIRDTVNGKSDSFNEMDTAWKQLRNATVQYTDLLRDLKWDMLFLDKRLNNPVINEDAVSYIYRNFISLFFILKFIGNVRLDSNIEKFVNEAINLTSMLHADWNRLLSGTQISDMKILEEKASVLWKECENIIENEASYSTQRVDKRNLLYQEIFLYDLTSLIKKIIDMLKLFMDNPEFIRDMNTKESVKLS